MKNREIHRGDLYYYDFGNCTGSVQSGEPVSYTHLAVLAFGTLAILKKRRKSER